MAKVNFTSERVTSFEASPDKTQTLYWDAKSPGLGLRVTPAGARAYIFESRLFGKTIRITIGDTRVRTLGQARTEAARLKTAIDDGIDPREQLAEKQAAHEARKAESRRKDVTVTDAWAVYIDAHRTKWSARHLFDHEKLSQAGGEPKKRGTGVTLAGPLAALMPLKLSALTAQTVSEWLQTETRSRPTNAAQSYRKLRAFIRWCEERTEYAGLVATNAYSARTVRELVPRPKAKDDCLQREQLTAWFSAVRQLWSPVASTYLQALLLTGARREEMAALRWDDVDFQWNSLSIADKVEGARTIPLTAYLASLLAELKRLNEMAPSKRELRRLESRGKTWAPSPWVFFSKTSEDGKIAEPRIAHNKALQAAQLPHVTLHGLRRSFGTLAEWCEVPVGVVAQIQGHKPSALAEKHYRRRPLDMLRMWHEKIEAWMLKEAGIQKQHMPPEAPPNSREQVL